MIDKIVKMIGVGDNIVVLTQTGRILSKSPKGKWVDKTPPRTMMEIEDVPRFKFGKFSGEPIADADPSYLAWCRDNIDGFRWNIGEDGKLFEEDLF